MYIELIYEKSEVTIPTGIHIVYVGHELGYLLTNGNGFENLLRGCTQFIYTVFRPWKFLSLAGYPYRIFFINSIELPFCIFYL